jgi:TonB family protein
VPKASGLVGGHDATPHTPLLGAPRGSSRRPRGGAKSLGRVIAVATIFRSVLAVVAVLSASCLWPPEETGSSTQVLELYYAYAGGRCQSLLQHRVYRTQHRIARQPATALLRAYCLERVGNSAAALIAYRTIESEFAGSPEARSASLRLQQSELPAADLVKEGQEGSTPKWTHTVEPEYPVDLRAAGIEGWVFIRFSVDSTGTPCDFRMIDSDPPFLFERTALEALRQCRFEAKEFDNAEIVFTFKLEQSSGSP